MKLAAAAAALALCGCASDVTLPASDSETLDPVAFFAGRTHGEAMLDTLIESPVRVTVDSVGRMRGNALVLDQVIRSADKPARIRRWTMWPVSPNRFSGSLTDATGPVHGTTEGPRAYIRYTMKNGFKVEQQLALQSDGRTILNRLEVTKFGLRVATLTETIRKLD
ncbi:MAG: DUF3833 domain-containing protein [Pseudomonadota bacterium]|nr:DUF3833 family protein [Sphingomonas sp.]MDQ3479384.1 DUF3833 domain-containing protein [Pseudomonadota bacterium]